MAAFKSMKVSYISYVALLVLGLALAVQTQVAESQPQQCAAQLNTLNVCAPFVLPGAANTNPSAECCGALQNIQHDCLCNTLRIAARLPSQCSIPPLNCETNPLPQSGKNYRGTKE